MLKDTKIFKIPVVNIVGNVYVLAETEAQATQSALKGEFLKEEPFYDGADLRNVSNEMDLLTPVPVGKKEAYSLLDVGDPWDELLLSRIFPKED